MAQGAPAAVALEHMTGPSRGSMTWLTASALDITLDGGCFLQIAEAQPGPRPEGFAARLHRIEDTFEIEAAEEGVPVWVNGTRVRSARLEHGDTIEFGESGPLCRCRVFAGNARMRNSPADIISDIGAYLRVSRQPPLKRTWRAATALFARLCQETTILFRVSMLLAIAGLAVLVYQQRQLNARLAQEIRAADAQLETVATALVSARDEALRPADLAELRDLLEQQVAANMTRLEELEQRSGFGSRVVAQARGSVAFLQGTYGFRELGGERMLRRVVTPEGLPVMSPRGRPMLSLEGEGPVVELQFTGTGFFAGPEGRLVTNRHVALPWEHSTPAAELGAEGLEPVMVRFISYLPGEDEAVPVSFLTASETADLALLRREGGAVPPGLALAAQAPSPGGEVIVMGYPTGLRAMVVQSGAAFVKELQQSGNTGFWAVSAQLAAHGHIVPLASRGIVGRQTASYVVYDAETTHGGSGGPVLDVRGQVVAVNSAILPEFGGSNLGVPAAEVRALLERAAGG
ncbi:trypsin-like peptidase domain-containing protein [Roseobacteraceae bacterium NS-SX3]